MTAPLTPDDLERMRAKAEASDREKNSSVR